MRSNRTTWAFLWRCWPWLVLLTAVALRLYALTSVPPGLTHDEADHTLTAWSIVNGVRAIYFPIAYGREPLYDYLTAVLMAFLGPTYLAGRLTAVYVSLLLVAGMFTWVRHAFDRPTALLTAAGLATSFWPLMTGRQILRSTLLPTLFVLALLLFWHGLRVVGSKQLSGSSKQSPTTEQWPLLTFAGAGLCLGLTFYTYIPARVLWAVLPTLLLYLALANRPLLRKIWPGMLLMLLPAALVGWPLFRYLAAHPETEVRITELQAPLTAVAQGNFTPLWHNVSRSLGLFTVAGDPSWRYNLPGQPFLPPVLGLLFYLGLLVAIWQAINPLLRHTPALPRAYASFLALVWLLTGLSPALVTGPEWSVTQAIGMQPVLYLFPALGLVALGKIRIGQRPLVASQLLGIGAPLLLFGATAVATATSYFSHWANDPNVRVQYETTLVTAINYLNQHGAGEVSISTIAPHPFHSPAVAASTLHNPAVHLHWFNGTNSLLLPTAAHSTLILPGFTPLPASLASYLTPAAPTEILPLRPTDLDRPLLIYQLDKAQLQTSWLSRLRRPSQPTQAGDRAAFLGYALSGSAIRLGETLSVVTLWELQRPLPNAQLFTHLLDSSGQVITQADQLGAPGEGWQSSDWLLQLHQIKLSEPTGIAPYRLVVGLYSSDSQQRQPIWVNNQPAGDTILLETLSISP